MKRRLVYEPLPEDFELWNTLAEAAANRAPVPRQGDASTPFPLLGSTAETPRVRTRLHTICALYANSARMEDRMRLLDTLESVVLEVAQVLAAELLDNGWRPEDGPRTAA